MLSVWGLRETGMGEVDRARRAGCCGRGGQPQADRPSLSPSFSLSRTRPTSTPRFDPHQHALTHARPRLSRLPPVIARPRPRARPRSPAAAAAAQARRVPSASDRQPSSSSARRRHDDGPAPGLVAGRRHAAGRDHPEDHHRAPCSLALAAILPSCSLPADELSPPWTPPSHAGDRADAARALHAPVPVAPDPGLLHEHAPRRRLWPPGRLCHEPRNLADIWRGASRPWASCSPLTLPVRTGLTRIHPPRPPMLARIAPCPAHRHLAHHALAGQRLAQARAPARARPGQGHAPGRRPARCVPSPLPPPRRLAHSRH